MKEFTEDREDLEPIYERYQKFKFLGRNYVKIITYTSDNVILAENIEEVFLDE